MIEYDHSLAPMRKAQENILNHQEHQEVPPEVDVIARTIVDSGLKLHKTLGPGLLESAYEHCLAYELHTRGLEVRRQVALPVVYETISLDAGYRIDLLVENSVIVGIKSVDALTRVHDSQLLTYLKLSRLRVGLLMNFNMALFKNGVRRLVI